MVGQDVGLRGLCCVSSTGPLSGRSLSSDFGGRKCLSGQFCGLCHLAFSGSLRVRAWCWQLRGGVEGVCIPSPPVVLGTVLGTPAAPLSSPHRRSKDKQNSMTTQERQYTRALGLRRC